MKNQLSNLMLTAVAASVLGGCASMDRGYTDTSGPSSALAFTTVTDAKELTKWTGSRFLQFGLRSVDTYYFTVPDTGYNPGAAPGAVGGPGYTVETGRGDMVTTRDTTYDIPGPYQSETGSYKIIQYRPGHNR
jgi:hypothetical protein